MTQTSDERTSEAPVAPAAAAAAAAAATLDLAQVLGSREVLLRIDAALAPAGVTCRGWAIVDAANPFLPWARVHVRPWLRDPNGMPGLRVERQSGPLAEERLPPGEGLVLLARDAAALQDAALGLLRASLQQRRPYLCLCGDAGGALRHRQNGALHPLPPPRALPAAASVRIDLRGRGHLALETTLPAVVRVRSAEPRDALLVQAATGTGFIAEPEWLEIISADGSPVGDVRLCLDFCPQDGVDRLVVRPEGVDGRILLRSAIRLHKRTHKGPFSKSATVRLHVLFDCTTLDQEYWPRALQALSALAEEEGQETREERPMRKWNLDIRRQLAAALQACVEQLHRKVTLDLWWFADVPRPDMAPPDGLPIAPAAWGHPGERRLETLPQALLESDFDYGCGMDLFDAADEALEQVAGRIAELPGERHAVLLVGDSPPPPADEDDPLWRRIVDAAPRTNARRSPRFRRTLAALSRAGVPVGWLFVRHRRSAEESRQGLDSYPRFQTLREDILAALQQLGFPVEGCDGVGDLERSLGVLLGRMKREPVSASLLAIEEG